MSVYKILFKALVTSSKNKSYVHKAIHCNICAAVKIKTMGKSSTVQQQVSSIHSMSFLQLDSFTTQSSIAFLPSDIRLTTCLEEILVY